MIVPLMSFSTAVIGCSKSLGDQFTLTSCFCSSSQKIMAFCAFEKIKQKDPSPLFLSLEIRLSYPPYSLQMDLTNLLYKIVAFFISGALYSHNCAAEITSVKTTTTSPVGCWMFICLKYLLDLLVSDVIDERELFEPKS
ncbi:hypothetical protein [Niemeyer virus]|nr:hypothetical protein [Niemeyer virus]